jgi:hypothetical protein
MPKRWRVLNFTVERATSIKYWPDWGLVGRGSVAPELVATGAWFVVLMPLFHGGRGASRQSQQLDPRPTKAG